MKVLYSFDNENKTNCLARWPQAIDVRTAYLDENTQIGVIELKLCIQAIVAASPELVAKLGQDYTVYAYDYSEYETPLVGQGMLSWVLASSSSTPSAPAHQSRTIVTGRVCKNILGLFSNSSQETLEVKLRLVPVPTSLQSEYIESMKKYRDISQMMPQGFDPQAWTAFIQANPNFMQLANQSRSHSPAVAMGQSANFGIEHVQRLMSGDRSTQGPVEGRPALSRTNSTLNAEHGAQLQRPSSAASSAQSGPTSKRRGRPPGGRTARARAAKAKKVESSQAQASHVDTDLASNDEGFEEGPNRKRAKVIQAEWSGKGDFGKQPESLRVAASTAASVRIHQPTAVRPNDSLASSLEGPPREPTPIADTSTRPQRPQLPPTRSSLRHESFAAESKTFNSSYTPQVASINAGESAMTSPEASLVESSPVDLASSPPIYHGASTAPSSPHLPALPRPFDDSGFMSGSIDDLFEDFDEMRSIDDEDLEIAAQYSKRSNLVIDSPPHTEQVEPRLPELPSLPPKTAVEDDLEAKAAEQKKQMQANARLLSRTASSGDLDLPPVPISEPIRPQTLHRSQTWSCDQESHPRSDNTPTAPITELMTRPASRERKGSESGTGSGAKRRQAIQSKLASSVAAGEMPPFCENCGAIETPTWRKAWVKIHSGTPEHVVISDDEGGIIAWQRLQTDQEGNVSLYRIIKKSLLKTDEGFTEILLCNRKLSIQSSIQIADNASACGLWLHTRKCMRPKEFWEKPFNGGNGKGKRINNAKKQRSASASAPSANDAAGAPAMYSDASSPANDSGQTDALESQPQLPVLRHRRASSDQLTSPQNKAKSMDDASAFAALERAIKSSPHNFKGSKDIPIDIENLTPQPTRRVLFPTPSQSKERRSKHSPGSTSKRSASRVSSPKANVTTPLDQSDKENCPPTEDHDKDQVFQNNDGSQPRSKTPSPTSSREAAIPRTPVRSTKRLPPTTGDFFSSAAKALLHPPKTPKKTSPKDSEPLGELTPFTIHLNQLLSDTNNFSPGSQNFDFPSLPSLRNTPGRSTRALDFDFSQFDSQDLLSTDIPMPSSPPLWFGVYEDPVEQASDPFWGEYQAEHPGTPDNDNCGGNGGPKTPGLVVDENGRASIDFQATD